METSTREELYQKARYFHTKRRLGQNFLVDPDVLSRIAGAIDPQPQDCVIEIGPGLGFLTEFLAQTGCRIVAIDLDRECVEALGQRNLQGVEVIHQDFLQYDLNAIESDNLKVIGNVPYQITTPIVARLFGEIGAPSPWLHRIKSLVMTVQREVAYRFTATPDHKEYSMITLLVDYFAKAELLEIVPSDAFVPEPNVTSAVVRFTPHQESPIDCSDHKLLRQIIRAGFKQRRKMLRNNLGFLKITPDQAGLMLASLRIDPLARAEKLTLEQFARITNAVTATR